MTPPFDNDSIERQAQRYLQDKLSDSEKAAFEAYIIANPHVVEQLEIDAALTSGFRALNPISVRQRLMASLKAWLTPQTLVASACTFALGIVVSYVMPLNNAENGIASVSNVVYLDTLRSFEPSDNVINIGNTNQHEFVFFLQTGPRQKGPFEVSLWQKETNEAQLNLSHAPLTNTGEVVVTVPASILQDGTYTLDVTDISSQSKTSTQFTVVREQ